MGACLAGAGAELVTVEARFEPADKQRTEVVLTGLPDPVLRESRGRLLCALDAAGMHVPQGRLFLNLVPAARRKTGGMLDLALALAGATAIGHLHPRALDGHLFLGELGIDGRLHDVPGGLAAADAARGAGTAVVVGPPATAAEAAALPGVLAYAARDLTEVLGIVGGEELPAPLAPPLELAPAAPEMNGAAHRALDQVRGHAAAKRALAVAAAGGHGLLLVGPPGTGKTLLARALPELLPPLDAMERLDVTRVLSAAGRWPGGLASKRPFRAPHHTTSYAGLVGGGAPPGPGEATLAHRGVLFLDELPEFRREALEALRQPLEGGVVHLARAGHQVELPARFQLVCAMNPCPCGYRGHPRVPCRCAPSQVERYRQRISGPLLDRIDLRIEVQAPAPAELGVAPDPGSAGAVLARAVSGARARMTGRQGGRANAALDSDDLDRWVPLAGELGRLAERATERRGLSARALQSLRRVARTLADLAEEESVGAAHLAEALALRAPL